MSNSLLFDQTEVPTFIGKALNYTTANLVLTAIGICITYFFAIPMIAPLWSFGAAIVLSFLITYLAKKDPTAENNNSLRLAVFGLFIWLGYALSPYIFSFIFFIPNGPMLVIGAAITTAFISLTTALYARYAIETGQADKYILMRPLLMNVILGLIVVGLLNGFLHMPLLMLLEGLAGACVFTLFLLSDILVVAAVNNQSGGDMNEALEERMAILCGANIALDITNIFVSLLEIADALGDNNNRHSIGQSISNLVMTLVGPLLMLGVVFGINDWFFKEKQTVGGTYRATPATAQELAGDQKPSFIAWCFGSSPQANTNTFAL